MGKMRNYLLGELRRQNHSLLVECLAPATVHARPTGSKLPAALRQSRRVPARGLFFFFSIKVQYVVLTSTLVSTEPVNINRSYYVDEQLDYYHYQLSS